MRVPPRMAALVNGATSHALDYDDTHFAHVGHLSVGIYPAALAIAEMQDASAEEMITAFIRQPLQEHLARPWLPEGSLGSIVCKCVTRLAYVRRGPLA